MSTKQYLPVYGLENFSTPEKSKTLYQVEVFDTNRHFKVSYPHKHNFYEILYLSNGSGIHIIDDKHYLIHPPCVFFLSPGQAHKLDLSHDIEGYIFLFSAEFYLINQHNTNRLLEFPFFFPVDNNNPPLKLASSKQHEFIRSLFIRGQEEVARKDACSDELVRSLLDLILFACDQIYPLDELGSQKRRSHILVKNFLRLIEENYQNNLSINEYASRLAISPNHLTQIVKQISGKTSSELLQEKIVIEIKRLLLHTNLTVSEIANQFHFADQSYFTKYFKKATGITPLQFRKKSMIST